jgi:hypothetical protein
MSASRPKARIEAVLDRCDAYMKKLARAYARGRRDFQEDLLQEARREIHRRLLERPPERGEYRSVIKGAMRNARKQEVRYRRRFVSLDALLEVQEERARMEEAAA